MRATAKKLIAAMAMTAVCLIGGASAQARVFVDVGFPGAFGPPPPPPVYDEPPVAFAPPPFIEHPPVVIEHRVVERPPVVIERRVVERRPVFVERHVVEQRPVVYEQRQVAYHHRPAVRYRNVQYHRAISRKSCGCAS
jgi:hypothetical protein